MRRSTKLLILLTIMGGAVCLASIMAAPGVVADEPDEIPVDDEVTITDHSVDSSGGVIVVESSANTSIQAVVTVVQGSTGSGGFTMIEPTITPGENVIDIPAAAVGSSPTIGVVTENNIEDQEPGAVIRDRPDPVETDEDVPFSSAVAVGLAAMSVTTGVAWWRIRQRLRDRQQGEPKRIA